MYYCISMKIFNSLDILVNSLAPVLSGLLIYLLADPFFIPPVVVNYFPDFAWAYAFISALLIIWDRTIHIFWIFTAVAIAFLFESLQYYGVLPGTGDLFDVLIYLFACCTALYCNPYFKHRFSIK
jgi:hypothetical protein